MQDLKLNFDLRSVEEDFPLDYEEGYVWIPKCDCRFEGEYVVVPESAIPPARSSFLPDDFLAE